MKDIRPSEKRALFWKWSFFIFGLIVLSLGISLTIKADEFGIGPWDVLHYGLWKQFGLTIGIWSILAGVVIVGSTSIFQKRLPQLGTVLNMLLIGFFIDFFNLWIETPDTYYGKAVMFLLGVVILGYGIGVYVAPSLGAGPRDSLMLLISKATKWKISWVRNGMEMTVLLLGWLLGGPVGFGTVIIAVALGPIIAFSISHSQSLLKRLIERGDQDEDLNKRPVRVNYYDGIGEEVR